MNTTDKSVYHVTRVSSRKNKPSVSCLALVKHHFTHRTVSYSVVQLDSCKRGRTTCRKQDRGRGRGQLHEAKTETDSIEFY